MDNEKFWSQTWLRSSAMFSNKLLHRKCDLLEVFAESNLKKKQVSEYDQGGASGGNKVTAP